MAAKLWPHNTHPMMEAVVVGAMVEVGVGVGVGVAEGVVGDTQRRTPPRRFGGRIWHVEFRR